MSKYDELVDVMLADMAAELVFKDKKIAELESLLGWALDDIRFNSVQADAALIRSLEAALKGKDGQGE